MILAHKPARSTHPKSNRPLPREDTNKRAEEMLLRRPDTPIHNAMHDSREREAMKIERQPKKKMSE
jgi:hypothetical protein